MTKTGTASVILLLLYSTVARAGTLAWAPFEFHPAKSDCQPISFLKIGPSESIATLAGSPYAKNSRGIRS